MSKLESLINTLDLPTSREAILEALEARTASASGERRYIWSLLHDALHWTPEWPSKETILELVELAQRPRTDYGSMKSAVLRNGLNDWPILPPGLI